MAVEKLRRLELWARLGYAARGFVYILLGWVALSTGRALSTDDAVAEVEKLPASTLLLGLLAAGLFGYALFKIYAAAIDLDHKGDDAKGRASRIGAAIGGAAYLGLGWVALKVLFGGDNGRAGRAAGSGGSEQQTASEMAQTPGGGWLLVIAALVVIGIAIGQLVIAWKASFMDEMPRCPSFAKPAGRLGYAARALVIFMVGWFLLRAGSNGDRVRNFGDVLAILRTDHGLLFVVVAAGLVAFGVTSLIMAWYRRIEDRDIVDDLERGIDKATASVKN